jgi:hypothetical protein
MIMLVELGKAYTICLLCLTRLKQMEVAPSRIEVTGRDSATGHGTMQEGGPS